jgi:hypothetical protein
MNERTFKEVEKFVEKHVLLCVTPLIDSESFMEDWLDSGEYASYETYRQDCDSDCDSDCDVLQLQDLILEYWAVSDCLGRLLEKGEVVLNYGMYYVWGRQASGQAIAQDSVIQEIFLALDPRPDSCRDPVH